MDVSDWKFASTTRRVPQDAVADLVVAGNLPPVRGDLLLARVLEPGRDDRLELADGRRATLFAGDHVVVCHGSRHAPDRFARNGSGDATRMERVALLAGRDGRRLNVADFALERRALPTERPTVMAVLGASRSTGKTATAASLVRGLHGAGVEVGAAKVTGTDAGGDPWHLVDAGAARVLDFVDAGEVSTTGLGLGRLQEIVATVTSHLVDDGMEAIVLEVADGLLQDGTAALACSPVFRNAVDGILFAAGDASGAAAGCGWLLDRGLPVVGLSGVMTSSWPARRAAEEATGLPVLGREELADEGIAMDLLASVPLAPARLEVAPLIAA
jgi:hypothetical protein